MPRHNYLYTAFNYNYSTNVLRMQIYDIKTNAEGKELTEHGEFDFPCAFYDETFSCFINQEVPWHWHTQLEIVMAVEGTAKVEGLGQSYEINSGDVVIVNANAMHHMTSIGNSDCRILNVVLDPLFIAGNTHSKIYKRYLLPAFNNTQFSLYKLSNTVPWQAEAITSLSQAFEQLQSKGFGYEIAAQSLITQFWYQFSCNEPKIFANAQRPLKTEQRIQRLIAYIEGNFSQQIQVSDLSQAAQISDSECYRLFKNYFQCSPNNYLLNFRLQQAAKLLVESEQSVTEVALAAGFNSHAYFSKKFKHQYSHTPRQFRRLCH